MEGSKFKRNVIDKIPAWIRLVDVPHSYWSKEGLSLIALAVGKPLKFDDLTARFEPIKFTGIQIEFIYTAPRPDFIWVPILDCDENEENIKVEIQYTQIPYSCSLCPAFGHSLARCMNNPDAVKPKNDQQKTHGTGHAKRRSDTGAASIPTGVQKRPSDHLQEPLENYINNMEMVPYVIGEFMGCKVVMDDDKIIKEAQKSL